MDKVPSAALISELLGQTVTAVSDCLKGGNNRAYRIDTPNGAYFAKQYFRSEADTRDRLDNEWKFLAYAAQHNVPHVPRPIARDDAHSLAIYSFLEGARPPQVTRDMVAQVGGWTAALNRKKHSADARALPNASESCFSAESHLTVLQQRFAVLEAAARENDYGTAFADVFSDMKAALAEHSDALLLGCGALGVEIDEELPHAERCLSPSDFGFHNSLVLADGTVQLLDFEYAGWDDPAKMLCDFFLHPGMAVNGAWLPDFWEPVKATDADPEATIARAALLYPLLGLRWCCIILNVFVPAIAARRQFADVSWDIIHAQDEQLAKARAMLDKLAQNPFTTAR